MRNIIIGDVHGCLDELKELIHQLQLYPSDRLFFIGDLIDKGPDSVGVVKYAFELSKIYSTNLVLGNHEEKFLRYLYNKDNNLRALKEMLITPDFENLAIRLNYEEIEFLKQSYYTYSIKEYNILLLHGGLTENCNLDFSINHQYSQQKKIKELDLITKTRHLDQFGKFVSLGQENEHTQFWAETYDGKYGKVIFGHNTFMQSMPKYFQNAIGIDMGCVYGQHLLALIISKNKMEYISIPAKNKYCN
jgi:serine/threonine protein phosphatase 1